MNSVYILNVYNRENRVFQKYHLFATKASAQREMAKRVKWVADTFLQEYDNPSTMIWRKLNESKSFKEIYEARRKTCLDALQMLQREQFDELEGHHILGPGFYQYVRYEILEEKVHQ